jgi:hypothetical protein
VAGSGETSEFLQLIRYGFSHEYHSFLKKKVSGDIVLGIALLFQSHYLSGTSCNLETDFFIFPLSSNPGMILNYGVVTTCFFTCSPPD